MLWVYAIIYFLIILVGSHNDKGCVLQISGSCDKLNLMILSGIFSVLEHENDSICK